jgi:hypothetical protein
MTSDNTTIRPGSKADPRPRREPDVYAIPGCPDRHQEYQDDYLTGARAMLDALVTVHPNHLSREELAVAAGITASGGTFTTYLGRRRRNGLVEVDGPQVRVSATLFLGRGRPEAGR